MDMYIHCVHIALYTYIYTPLHCILCTYIHVNQSWEKGKQKKVKYLIWFQKKKISCFSVCGNWSYALPFSISSALIQINKKKEGKRGKMVKWGKGEKDGFIHGT